MAVGADHEVIDSPEALFQHLYEAHHVEEARDLDPLTAPLQFWLRRHAELEHEARQRREPREPEPPVAPNAAALAAEAAGRRAARPQPPSQPHAQLPPRARPFADALVEAVALALARRGHDERAVRATVAAYGEQRLRARFLEPLLDDVTAELRGGARTRDRALPQERERPQPPQPKPAAPPRDAWDSREPDLDDDFMAIANALNLHRQGRSRRAERRAR
jgi:hypothetical protein